MTWSIVRVGNGNQSDFYLDVGAYLLPDGRASMVLDGLLPAIDPSALPTVAEAVQLVAALAIPLGTFLVLQKPAVIRWKDVLRMIGGIMLPALLIIALQEALPVAATALLVGAILGHAVTMVDTD